MNRTVRFERITKVVLIALMATCARGAVAQEPEEGSGQEPAVRMVHRDSCHENVLAQISVDQGHPWCPPFGLDRVGSPPVVHVELAARQLPTREYYLATYRDGREVERHELAFSRNPSHYAELGFAPPEKSSSFFGHAPLASIPSEVTLTAQCAGRSEELVRQSVTWPELEAEVTARPDHRINPVDLGTILPPHDWLLLAGGQAAVIDVAALSQARDVLRSYSEFWKTNTVKQYRVGDRKVRQWVVMAANEQKLSPTAESGNDVKMMLTLMLDGYAGLEHAFPIWPLYKDVQELIRQSGITYTPTLTANYADPLLSSYFLMREPIEDNPKLTRFVPQAKIESERLGRRFQWVREDQWAFPHIAWEADRITAAGGRVGMGSHGELQGLAVHWELWGFGMGGMSPIEILRTATINGAEAIGLGREIDSLEPGKLADFQVLDRNPLEDIRNTDSIRWVVLGGRIYDGDTLRIYDGDNA